MLDLPGMRLTERDKAILSSVSRYRFLTTSHILSLVPGSRQNLVRRLQRLYHAGFLDRPRGQLPLRYARELFEFVYSPTRQTLSQGVAKSIETDSWGKCRAVSSLFLAHALAVSDALIRFEADCRLHGLSFIAETDIIAALPVTQARRFAWRVMIRGGAETESIGVVPDAAFAVEHTGHSATPRRWHFFLELDRGTMPLHRKSLRQSSIHRKVLAYSRTRISRALKDSYGISGFQVIFIARSEERLKHIRETCDAATKGRASFLFLFATQEELRLRNHLIASAITGNDSRGLG